ncbi:hypothetical protein [Cupriavidus sp. IDO]|uniref:hypothetical protein n=1 Tax=Cupriavidus sp. IDO TaxID=1539142 RepID=UPI00057934F7|nr:hypothetical protein [Cupriavidus sp. IDO]KWR88895.1 hypothetical protein RM96_17065 [Cupriavidus sp. IDO]
MSHTSIAVDDDALRRHSFDLVHFPMYLAQRVPPRVRVEIIGDHEHADLMGLYTNARQERSRKYAKLIADERGCVTKSDAFFHAVHAEFSAGAGDLTYLGFSRAGPPVYAPLFALAILYRKYGRGLYRAGQILPTPWPELTSGYTFSIR